MIPIKACSWTEVSGFMVDLAVPETRISFEVSWLFIFSGLIETISLHVTLHVLCSLFEQYPYYNDCVPSGQQKMDCVHNCDDYKSNHPELEIVSNGSMNITLDSGILEFWSQQYH